MSSIRIYLCTAARVDYLVRAGSQAGALRHVTRKIVSVRVATQDDIVAAMQTGVEVETAGDTAEPEVHVIGSDVVRP